MKNKLEKDKAPLPQLEDESESGHANSSHLDDLMITHQFREVEGADAEIEGNIVESDFIFPQWYDLEFGSIMAKQQFASVSSHELMKLNQHQDFKISSENIQLVKPFQYTQIENAHTAFMFQDPLDRMSREDKKAVEKL